MREDAKGTTLVEDELTVSTATLQALGRAIGTPGAGDTATLVPYFGAVIGGESTVVDGLGLDLSRALLAGIGYEWHRPFVPDERVRVRVVVEDVYAKGANQFGIVVAEFADLDGALVQRQSITFIERGGNR
ncbi:MaoC family dehydratase N-terminal domain-containing protein [Pseudonocardia sp. H11422]|uniref:FAS1-like dehydratase domain-containing protein n=1 Tax=Pseudonocardia sp. H11422 TaxID=2835866 RepID=UPI001BDC0C6D|nr:MaoC family dehydratase N-terminal domain-containing protein [Pseudonocardia sp. H11422]